MLPSPNKTRKTSDEAIGKLAVNIHAGMRDANATMGKTTFCDEEGKATLCVIIAYGEGAEKIHHAYNKINQAE